MATARIKPPPQLTGNNVTDIQDMNSYLGYLQSQLNYYLNNIDDENTISRESEE